MLTLVTSTVIPSSPLGPEYALRTVTADDIPALARLYFVAYDTGDAATSIEEARDDMEASLAGDYGALWPAASPVIVTGSRIVAAALTVHRAPWPDAPTGAFIIELFTDRTHRRRGLATALLAHVTGTALVAGHATVGLRVSEDNAAARSLYGSLGFRPPVSGGAGLAARGTGSIDR